MILYHVTTQKKVKAYHESGQIHAPVRGFTTLMGALAWACKTGRTVILTIEGSPAYKLPDHHNAYGDAWWIDAPISSWRCAFSADKDA